MHKSFAAITLAASMCLPGVAHAQEMRCAAREQVITFLVERLGEDRRAMGLTGRGAVMELFASAQGAWTITISLPDGRTCLLASGDGYEEGVALAPIGGRPM